MPNMTMTNTGGQSDPTTEAPVELSTSIIDSDSTSTRRPTRKPRPSRPPRTKRPSKTPSTSSSSSDNTDEDSTTHSPPTTIATPAAFITTRKPNSNQVSSSTESPGSYIEPYGVKRKFVHVAKKVGKAAAATLGVVGSVAVGSAVKTVGGQIAPLASIAVSKASSAALSAATQVGSYAADAAGRALINFAASLKNSTRSEQNEESPLVQPIEIHPNKKPEEVKLKDEGKIVTVYVKHTYMGDQPVNHDDDPDLTADEISRKTNHSTVYLKEDTILMDTHHVQDTEMEMVGGMTNSSSSSSPSHPEESEEESYERAEKNYEDVDDEPTIPPGATKIVNKDDRKMGKNKVCSNKPGILMTTISLALGTLTTINKIVS